MFVDRILNTPYLLNELSHVIELVIDTGKPYVGDLIDSSEFLSYTLAYVGAGYFPLSHLKNFLVHFVNEPVQNSGLNRPFVAGLLHTTENSLPIIGHSPTIAFYDSELGGILGPLVGGEPPITFSTLPASADNLAGFTGARIDDLIFIRITEGTTHMIRILRRVKRSNFATFVFGAELGPAIQQDTAPKRTSTPTCRGRIEYITLYVGCQRKTGHTGKKITSYAAGFRSNVAAQFGLMEVEL